MIGALAWFTIAAFAEIAGCFAFWRWARGGAPAWWLLGGIVALAAFAWILARVDMPQAGRAYAAYGGIYIVASLLWLWFAESARPNTTDIIGAGLAVAGTLVILAGRTST